MPEKNWSICKATKFSTACVLTIRIKHSILVLPDLNAAANTTKNQSTTAMIQLNIKELLYADYAFCSIACHTIFNETHIYFNELCKKAYQNYINILSDCPGRLSGQKMKHTAKEKSAFSQSLTTTELNIRTGATAWIQRKPYSCTISQKTIRKRCYL